MKSAANIFLIDDDKLFLFLTRKTILATKKEVNLKEFTDAHVALNYLKEIVNNNELWPDIIFLDISMPIMDGWDFLDEYMKLDTNIVNKPRIYIFSSSISPHDIDRAKSIGVVTDFIIKPLVKDKFIQILES